MTNESLIDLTVDDEGVDTTKGNAKPAKAPRRARPSGNEPVSLQRASVGKKKGRKLKIILIIVLVVLIAGFVFEEVYFNFLGTRDLFINAVVRLDPDFRSREAELDDREAELDSFEAELDAREGALQNRETQLDRRSSQLDGREAALSEQLILDDLPRFRRSMSEQEVLDMESLSRSYSLMAPEAAAVILGELVVSDDVAAILYFMPERSAAAILSVMDAEFAAEITEILLYD